MTINDHSKFSFVLIALAAVLIWPGRPYAEEPAPSTETAPKAGNSVPAGSSSLENTAPATRGAAVIFPKPSESRTVAPDPKPARLACKASRNDIGMFEPLRHMSITVDMSRKYVKMVHEGDGKTYEYRDGETGPQGSKYFVQVTDDNVSYGRQGHEAWKIDRYTGTLTNSSITISFECHPRPTERRF
jgi:hypothetical protein